MIEEKSSSRHMFAGMQRGVHPINQASKYLWDAHNVRITNRDGESMASVTNEKSTYEYLTFKIRDALCYYIGHAQFDNWLVVFCHYVATEATEITTFSISVYLYETDSTTFIKGATLRLLNSSGKAVKSWVTSGASQTLSGLAAGTYTLKEVSAADGYDVADDITVVIDEDGTITQDGTAVSEVIMYNDKSASTEDDDTASFTVKIRKIDYESSEYLEGCSLIVYDSDGNDVSDGGWTTGTTYQELTLPVGTYILHESATVDGYEVADDITFTVESSGKLFQGDTKVSYITMYNAQAEEEEEDEGIFTIRIYKRISETATGLAGASLELLDSDGNTVDSWTSTTSYRAVTGLVAGTYTLHESSAPSGYETMDDVTIEIDSDGNVTVSGDNSASGTYIYIYNTAEEEEEEEDTYSREYTITLANQSFEWVDGLEYYNINLIIYTADGSYTCSGLTLEQYDNPYNNGTELTMTGTWTNRTTDPVTGFALEFETSSGSVFVWPNYGTALVYEDGVFKEQIIYTNQEYSSDGVYVFAADGYFNNITSVSINISSVYYTEVTASSASLSAASVASAASAAAVSASSETTDTATAEVTSEYDTLDVIYRINLSLERDDIVREVLYAGDLGFDPDHPLQCVSDYEASCIQKVYWVDGINRPRLINITKPELKVAEYDETYMDAFNLEYGYTAIYPDAPFDFVPDLNLQETVKIERIANTSGGLFPSGVIQYAMTYSFKYGQESNIFYQSELLYLSHVDRGADAESSVYCAFKITVSDIETDRFDFINIYSIKRTAYNGTPVVQRVAKIDITEVGESDSVEFVDTNTTGVDMDSSYLTTVGGKDIVANMIFAKDGTLFLGGITYKRKDIGEIISHDSLSYEFASGYREVALPGNFSLSNNYQWKNQLTTNTSFFKAGETYRLGFQAQYQNGEWSEPVWIEDRKVDLDTRPYTELGEDEYTMFLPVLSCTLSDICSALYADGYKKIRPLVVFPKNYERSIIAQGVITGTVFQVNARNNNTPFAFSSWFFRPFGSIDPTGADENCGLSGSIAQYNHFQPLTAGRSSATEIQNMIIAEDGRGAVTENSKYRVLADYDFWSSITGKSNIHYQDWNSKYKNDQTYLCEDYFALSTAAKGVEEGAHSTYNIWYVDNSICTFHSPDIEFNDSMYDLINNSNNLQLRLCGLVSMDACLSNITFDLSSVQALPSAQGDMCTPSSNSYNGARGIISGLYFKDALMDDYKDYCVNIARRDESDSTHGVRAWMVYLWHRNGSLNNDCKRDSRDELGVRTAELKTKCVSNLRISNNTYFFNSGTRNNSYTLYGINADTDGICINASQFQVFDFDDFGILKFQDNYNSNGDIIYYGNVDYLAVSYTAMKFATGKTGTTEVDDVQEYVGSNFYISGSVYATNSSTGMVSDPQQFTLTCRLGTITIEDSVYNYPVTFIDTDDYTFKLTSTTSTSNSTTTSTTISSSSSSSSSDDDGTSSESSSDSTAEVETSEKGTSTSSYTVVENFYGQTYTFTGTSTTLNETGFSLTIDGITYKFTITNVSGLSVSSSSSDTTSFNTNADFKYNESLLYLNYDEDSESLPGDVNLADYIQGVCYPREGVMIKYKSTPHVVIPIDYHSTRYRGNLPAFNGITSGSASSFVPSDTGVDADEQFWMDDYSNLYGNIYQPGLSIPSSHFAGSSPSSVPRAYFWLCELVQDNVTNRFGGTTKEALENNVWVACGDAVELNDGSDVTITFSYGDTWYQRYDCLKSYPYSSEDINQVVEIGSFFCETHVNIDGRYDRNRGLVDNTIVSPTNFNLINKVYSQQNNYFTYQILDEDFYATNSFPSQFIWTGTKIPADTDAPDEWTNLHMGTGVDLDGTQGALTSFAVEGNTLYAFQERSIQSIAFNATTAIPTDTGVPITLQQAVKVTGYTKFASHVGCQDKFSIVSTSNGLYFVDNNNHGLYKISEGKLVNLSEVKNMRWWFKDNKAEMTWRQIVSDEEDYGMQNGMRLFSDPRYEDVYIVPGIDREDDGTISIREALCFSEVLGEFTSQMSYGGAVMMPQYGKYFAIAYMDEAEDLEELDLWQMFPEDRISHNCIFGTYYPFSLTFIANEDNYQTKVFDTVEMRADSYIPSSDDMILEGDTWDIDEQDGQPFNYIRVKNEYQDTGVVSATAKSFRKKFRVWRYTVPRGEDSRERIRNPWAMITLGKSDPGESFTILHDLLCTYTPF